ncbi:MAG: MFS transporter [Rhodospirillaceae bacterium]
MSEQSIRSLDEFRAGWQPLVGAIFGVGAGLTGIVFYTHGVFVIPLTEEFGWTRGATQFAFSFVMISALVTAPFIGFLSDKYGARKLSLISLITLSATFAALSLTTDQIFVYYALWIIMSVLAAGTFPVTWTRGVNTWFNANRGLALGLTMMGTGLVAAVGPAFAASLIEDYGWRDAYRVLGLALLVCTFPIAYFFFYEKGSADTDRADLGVKPKGIRLLIMAAAVLFVVYVFWGLLSNLALKIMQDMTVGLVLVGFGVLVALFYLRERGKGISDSHAPAGDQGLSPKEALSGYRFWVMGIALFFVCYGVAGLISNLVPLLMDKGYPVAEAASYAGFVGAMVVVGRLLVGYLIDRIWAPKVACLFLILPAVSCILLAQGELTPAMITIAALAIGLAAGAELDLIAYLTSRYFGMKHYGQLYGAQFIFFAIGSGAAPAVFGLSFDAFGSYELILYSTAGLFVLGGLMMLALGPYPVFAKSEAE